MWALFRTALSSHAKRLLPLAVPAAALVPSRPRVVAPPSGAKLPRPWEARRANVYLQLAAPQRQEVRCMDFGVEPVQKYSFEAVENGIFQAEGTVSSLEDMFQIAKEEFRRWCCKALGVTPTVKVNDC